MYRAVRNNTSGFAVAPGVAGTWIVSTEDGTISVLRGNQTVIKADNSATGAVYKGLAVGANATGTFLFAANFNSGAIDVFDSNYAKAALAGSFADPAVPAGYAPFNIQNLGGKLYVAYALQNAAKTVDVAGPGNGYVAVFDTNGNLLTHLISKGPLNSPWGLAIAPTSFGPFANDLLVGNFRDGIINAFDPSSGKFLGALQDPAGNPIAIIGLWTLQFGAGGSGGFPTTLYFTAGIPAGGNIQTHGLFGAITTTAPPIVNTGGIVSGATFTAPPNGLAPGSIAVVFGANLTDNGSSCLPPACNPVFRSDRRLNTTLAGAQVQINGLPVPMFYASPVQLGIQLPTELPPGSVTTLQVSVDGQSSPPSTITIGDFSPGIFTTTSNGAGTGVITHANGALVNAANPAVGDETVTIYATGLGQLTPFLSTGEVPTGDALTVTPTVMIDGMTAVVKFSGAASCCVGLNQINVVVPTNVHAGTNVSVFVIAGAQQSNTVNMPTKAAP